MRTSKLQHDILFYLDKRPVRIITDLSLELGLLRPSVSRSLHSLDRLRLIKKNSYKEWVITEDGKEVLKNYRLSNINILRQELIKKTEECDTLRAELNKLREGRRMNNDNIERHKI